MYRVATPPQSNSLSPQIIHKKRHGELSESPGSTTSISCASATPTTPIEEVGEGERSEDRPTIVEKEGISRPTEEEDEGRDMSSNSREAEASSPLSRRVQGDQHADNSEQPHHMHHQHPMFEYQHRYLAGMADYTSSKNTKNCEGRRCYRLNLERPFDIHCEQSPLVSSSGSLS